MSYQAIGQLVDKWMTDGEFRKNLRNNPAEAVKKCGVNLTSDEWAAVKQIDWSQSDEDLKARLNKFGVPFL